MIEAVQRFGVFKGFYLGMKRLSKCQPLSAGGFDPVPEKPIQPSTNKIVKSEHHD